MPTVAVKRDRLFQMLGKTFSDAEFEDLCFEFGIELDDVTSEKDIYTKQGQSSALLSEDVVYKIEVPANRYDLLCVEGLTQALRVFLGFTSPPTYTASLPSTDPITITQHPDTLTVRPFIVGAVLRGLILNDSIYRSFIDLQDKLHHNIGRRRTLVAIGTHDLDTITGPFTYEALPQQAIAFQPLSEDRVYSVDALFAHYKATNSHLLPYLPITENSPLHPVIYDHNRTVLSLPPIINGEHSKIQLHTRNVLIEATGTDYTKLCVSLNTIIAMFSQYCATPFHVEAVRIVDASGKTVVTPSLDTAHFVAGVDYINKGIGINMLAKDMVQLLGRMSLHALHNTSDNSLTVTAPITRTDILHACFPAADTRVLTDAGLQFLDEIEARVNAGKRVLYACYDVKSKAVCYRRGKLVHTPPPSHLLDFTSPEDVARWTEESGWYDLGSIIDPHLSNKADASSRHLSLRVTPNHNMYVQVGTEGSGGKVVWRSERVTLSRGTQAKAVAIPPSIVSASSLLSPCRCPDADFCLHRRASLRMCACAEAGHAAPIDGAERRRVQLDLGLSESQFVSFLELFGFWLGDGTMQYGTTAGTRDAVKLSLAKSEDREWLMVMLGKVGLAASDCYSVLTKKQEEIYITRPCWFAWFDAEFGVKYCRSQYYDSTSAKVERIEAVVLTTPASTATSLNGSSAFTSMSSGITVDINDLTDHADVSMSTSPPLNEEEPPTHRPLLPDPADPDNRIVSVKWFPSWVIMCLTPAELRLVIEGLRRANGAHSQGLHHIWTSGVRFRDQLMQALLHCGFSPYPRLAYPAGTIRGYCWHDCGVDRNVYSVEHVQSLSLEEQANYKPVKASADRWVVTWSTPTSSPGKGSCWPSMRLQEGISAKAYSPQRDGRIWCVTVDHSDHLIFAQRAERHGGRVTKQSRPIIVGNCDIMEDVAIAYGYNRITKSIPSTFTIAKQQPINKHSDQMREVAAQAGWTEVLTWALVSAADNEKNMRKSEDASAVLISQPKTAEFEQVRTSLLPGLLRALSGNKGLVNLPIRLFEVGDIVLCDDRTDVGAHNERRLAALYCGVSSGFEHIHGLLDRLLQQNGLHFRYDDLSPPSPSSPLYHLVPSSHPSFFPGRQADVVVGEDAVVIGRFGVVHPDVLTAFDVPYPCSAVEVDVGMLMGLGSMKRERGTVTAGRAEKKERSPHEHGHGEGNAYIH